MISDNTKKQEHKNPVPPFDNISRRIQPEESVAGHRVEDLRETAKECMERAKLNLQKDRHLMPACIVLTPKETMIVATPYHSEDEKIKGNGKRSRNRTDAPCLRGHGH